MKPKTSSRDLIDTLGDYVFPAIYRMILGILLIFTILGVIQTLQGEDKANPKPNPKSSKPNPAKSDPAQDPTAGQWVELNSIPGQIEPLQAEIKSKALETQGIMLKVKDLQLRQWQLHASLGEICRKTPGKDIRQDAGGKWACLPNPNPGPAPPKEPKK